MKSKFLKIIYIVLAFVFLGLGVLGVIIPVLPTTPFLLLASYFFAKGSERFHKWFLSTKLYQNHLADFLRTRGMSLKRKLSILLPVSTMLIVTAILINSLYVRVGICIIIVFKYYYFFAHIRTIGKAEISASKGVGINE